MQIYIFGGVSWDSLWQRPQALASALAYLGNQVFYIEPLSFKTGVMNIKRLCTGRKSSLREENGVYIFTPAYLPLPAGRADLLRRAGFSFLYRLQGKLFDKQLSRLAMRFHGRRVAIFNHPFEFSFAKSVQPNAIIYDCCDRYEKMPYVDPEITSAKVSAAEAIAMKGSHVVLTTSTDLYNEKKVFHPKVILLPNALDQRAFNLSIASPDDLPKGEGPIVGFVGAIAPWIDLELIERLALLRPQYQFVLIGPIFPNVNITSLSNRRNIHFIGSKPWDLLPSYYSQFDVAINPMLLSDLTHAANPIKIFEYLAFGLPVISTPIREISFFGNLISSASTPEEFAKQLDSCIREKPVDLYQKRIAFAKENTWVARANKLTEILKEML